MEIEQEVKPVRIDFQCPRCKQGFMRPTNSSFLSNPPIYPHKCTKCNYTENVTGKTYPYIDYK
jgi:ssDNA-binding Zn-finger/Zn-ribbon topoisomerase 1